MSSRPPSQLRKIPIWAAIATAWLVVVVWCASIQTDLDDLRKAMERANTKREAERLAGVRPELVAAEAITIAIVELAKELRDIKAAIRSKDHDAQPGPTHIELEPANE